jgi:hypothetical protein
MKPRTRDQAARDLDPVDLSALDRALEITRSESQGRSEQIDSMLEDRDWLAVAAFAAYCAQTVALNLAPWESPPKNADADGDRPQDKLLKRMLDEGLSQWEPDAATLQRLARRSR